MRSFCGSLFGAAKKTCGWHISEAELPLGLVTPTDVLRWRRQRGGFIRLCWNGKSGHQCVAVAAAAACGFITSKRRHCVNGAAGMLLTQMQQTLTDGRNAGAGFGNRESRQVLTAALPAVRFLLLPHSSADPGAAAIFSFFPFLSRPWAKARSRQKNKKIKQGRSYVIVSCLDNLFPNTYPHKQSQKSLQCFVFFLLSEHHDC